MKRTLIIFKKELLEMMRDKRVRNAAFITPIFLVVIMLNMFGLIQNTLSKKEAIEILVVGPENQIFKQMGGADVVKVKAVASKVLGEKLLREGKARLVVQAEPVVPGQPAILEALYDPADIKSEMALAAVKQGVQESNRLHLTTILKEKGIAPDQAEPLQVKAEELKSKEGTQNPLILTLLPYLIVVYALFGGASSAGEFVAGEKDKNTLETLLVSPASRTQIALGKFSALATICLAGSLSVLVALVLVSILKLPMTKSLLENGISVSPLAVLEILLLVLPLVAMFAGVMVAVSAYAKNTREAQAHLGILTTLVMVPAIFNQVIGFTDFAHAKWLAFVPVLNSATSIKLAMLGRLDSMSFFGTISVNLALGLIGIWFAIRMFNREQVLTRI